MADIIVYLVSKITPKMGESNLRWVDDEGLSELMGEGYEQVSSMERKVIGVKATMIVLRPSGENRGLARVNSNDDRMDVPDDFGNTRSVTVMEALAKNNRDLTFALNGMADPCHLGPARNHSMPGVSIISGELMGKAFDLGLTASKRGQEASSCPFPVGSAPYTRWMQGFRSDDAPSGGSVSQNAQQEAFNNGLITAKTLGRDDRADCPYPRGSPLRAHWLEGFKSGGGRVLP